MTSARSRRRTGVGRLRETITAARYWPLVLAMGAFALLPMYWMALTALRKNADLFAVPPKFWPTAIDPGVAWQAVSQTPLLGWLANSTLISSASTAAAVILGVPAGYALSRFRTRGTSGFAASILVTQMMPPLLLLVPIFVIFQKLSLTDSRTGIIVCDTATILPLTVWMTKAMIDAVPRELDEAAMVDGCSRWRALISVIVPACLPGLAAVAIYGFIETWDEFLFAKTLITSTDKWPASVGLYSFEGQYTTPINQVMMAALIFTIPPLVLFYFTRRGLVLGMTAGAVKG